MTHEQADEGKVANGTSKIMYSLLGAMFLLVTTLGGTIYASLSTRLQMAESEVARQAATLAAMRTQIEYSERDMKSLLNELTQVRGELIAVRILIASGQQQQERYQERTDQRRAPR